MDAGEAQPKRFVPLSEAQPVTFCCVAEFAKVIATIEANGLIRNLVVGDDVMRRLAEPAWRRPSRGLFG